MIGLIESIRTELKGHADSSIAQSSARFFKEPVSVYGVKTAVVTHIAKQRFKEIANLPNREIYKLCDELWESGYLEESFIACQWSYLNRKGYQAEDIDVFERWIKKYVSNWASCDTLCNHTVGEFIMMYPTYVTKLMGWAKDDCRWMRRAAAVTLIIPARKGMFLKEIFKIADALLLDKDDLVQKGYGWMLKSASEKHLKEVFDFVMERKSTMPRTALRYAIEKMPLDFKSAAMH